MKPRPVIPKVEDIQLMYGSKAFFVEYQTPKEPISMRVDMFTDLILNNHSVTLEEKVEIQRLQSLMDIDCDYYREHGFFKTFKRKHPVPVTELIGKMLPY